ncbi:hypothetical protein BU25DRAFT_207192 [Macroventuria anomochaeta]|uniref:Uncharacterized protein n=1 Tax=Macroventuria anomochaeta TaxID=301207 RepID=A0ACB6RMK1_9PLEO|nr:uncharacterized protein BU25DRAFT_207192 [Macroventuria anomochaeta]KAF2622630.1 hypothetical protein BU25DRAFT_207192 [Macroventuria anomochaeta]
MRTDILRMTQGHAIGRIIESVCRCFGTQTIDSRHRASTDLGQQSCYARKSKQVLDHFLLVAQLPSEVRMRDGAERNVTVSDRHGLASRVWTTSIGAGRSAAAMNFAANRRCRRSGTLPGRMGSGRRMNVPNSHVDAIGAGHRYWCHG